MHKRLGDELDVQLRLVHDRTVGQLDGGLRQLGPMKIAEIKHADTGNNTTTVVAGSAGLRRRTPCMPTSVATKKSQPMVSAAVRAATTVPSL